MERIHMNHIRDIIHRLQQGQSERQICRDTRLSRPTIHKYKRWAEKQGYLLPDSPTCAPNGVCRTTLPSPRHWDRSFRLRVPVQRWNPIAIRLKLGTLRAWK